MLISAVSPVAPEKVWEHKADFVISSGEIRVDLGVLPELVELQKAGYKASVLPIQLADIPIDAGPPRKYRWDAETIADLVRWQVVDKEGNITFHEDSRDLPMLSAVKKRGLEWKALTKARDLFSAQLAGRTPPEEGAEPTVSLLKLDLNQFLSERSRLRVLYWGRPLN